MHRWRSRCRIATSVHSHSELFCAGFATQRPVPIRRARDRLQRVGALFGGTTPLVTAWLVDRTGDLMMPAYCLMGASFIGIVSVLALRETARRPLPGSTPCVASRAEAQDLIRRGVDEGRVRERKFTPIGERA
ncbi:MFS transporter [Burkholderia territorii]|nr:MFS transporter [Burkholderia territorii]